ncbi:MAG: MurR/RpiR family transcriptional regulator [Pseudomonadota bacterium]
MLKRINRLLDELSPAERRVAEWLLAHPREALSSNLAELSRKAGTSEPTVVRFCRRAGASGFSDLKLRLAEALSRPDTYLHRDVTPGDSVGDVVMKVMDRSLQAIVAMRDHATEMPFEAAVEAMKDARQWVFCGLGASGDVARDACQKFFRLGVPCSTQTDTPSILQTAALLGEGDVLLTVSHTGRWKKLARAQAQALDQGAFVICFTQAGTPMAEAASLHFDCEVGEDASVYTPMSSRLAQLALLDALQVALALAIGEPAGRNLRRSKEALGAA